MSGSKIWGDINQNEALATPCKRQWVGHNQNWRLSLESTVTRSSRGFSLFWCAPPSLCHEPFCYATTTALHAQGEVPLTESPLRIDPTQLSETPHTAANRDHNDEVPMVPLERITPPPTLPPSMGSRPSSHGFVRDCHAVPGLAWVSGRPPFPPFPMRQGVPLKHHTIVYSMPPNRQ